MEKYLLRVVGVAVVAALALVCIVEGTARAALGEPVQSVETDRARMLGQVRDVAAPGMNFTVKRIASATGLVVREYVSPSGTVFAVSWHGPTPPDLRTLLGSYFGEYTAAAAKAPLRPGRRYLALKTQSGAVIQTGGHMRDLRGRAFIPSLFPSGVSEGDIQ